MQAVLGISERARLQELERVVGKDEDVMPWSHGPRLLTELVLLWPCTGCLARLQQAGPKLCPVWELGHGGWGR